MNSLGGFNSQEIRRLHPYLATLLRQLKALEVKVEAGTKIVWGRDEDILPTGNENLAGILRKFARADHQHLFKFPTTIPLATPDGSAFFDISASAINIYVDDTPTTRVVAGGTDSDVRATKRRDTGTVPRYAFADHSHPTAVLPKNDPQPPEIDEIRYDEDDKLVRWDGDNWVPLSVEDIEFEGEWGTNDDVQPTRLQSAGTATRFARADHSHPTALLPQGDTQTPVEDEIRYNTDNKIVRWNGSSWVPLSVEDGAEAGSNDDVQPTRLRNAGTSTRYARADHSHPTAILPQGNTQTPAIDEIRYNTDNKLVRWNGTTWVPLSVETFTVEWGTDSDVRPTKRLSAGQSPRFARADHSHPTAILPQADAQMPEADEIRYTADNKIVRWNATAGQWVPLSVETFTVEWGNDVEPTRRRNAGASTRFARADHSHPTAILPQGDAQTPVADEIRFNDENKLVRWDGTAWVPLSVETFDFEAEWGEDDDVQPTGLQSAGSVDRFARADHSHPTAILPQSNTQTPVENEIRFTANDKIVRWDGSDWVPLSVETGGGEAGTEADVQPTRLQSAGASLRYARADHSHPTAILPQSDAQTPVIDEIRYNANNKIVRWNGSSWVELSVETFTITWATSSDVQPTKRQSTGSSTRFARADHSHPTAILPQDDPQTPVRDELRYTDNNKIVRWDSDYAEWVPLSVETFIIERGTDSDVQPTARQSAGTSFRLARADHSHPTAILPLNDPQTPVANEIRFDPSTNQLFRRITNGWTAFTSGLPVPANPLVLPFTNDVISPLNRQLVNHSSWDNIGNATVFYRDANNSQYRLIFARPLAISTTSTPSGKDFWTNQADELVLKEGTGFVRGAVLWRRRGNTSEWSAVSVQLSDISGGLSFPTDVGVLARSPLTGTTNSRRWFLQGVQEGGSFRAPFVGFATFTASTTPAPSALATNLGDAYAYYIQDLERVDIVRPITNGSTLATMLPHYVIAPPCRVFSTATDTSGHYIRDELWNGVWIIRYYTTTSATTDLTAVLPTITVPIGIQSGRPILYLHNPQSSAISVIFSVAVRRPTSTGITTSITSDTTISIPANTTVIANLGVLTFSPSTTLSHPRSQPLTIAVIRRRSQESANANSVICLGVAIVPERV